MEILSLMNINACTAQSRSGMSETTGMPEWFRIGNHEVAPSPNEPSCTIAGIGEQGRGGRVSADGEDV